MHCLETPKIRDLLPLHQLLFRVYQQLVPLQPPGELSLVPLQVELFGISYSASQARAELFHSDTWAHAYSDTVRVRSLETGGSEASKRVSIFSFATQGGKQVSFYFRQGNWVQARDAQIRFPAG